MKLLKTGYALLLCVILIGTISCTGKTEQSMSALEGDTWAEKLGYPADTRIIIFHADDAGMCEEANIATIAYLENNEIQSTAAMAPCPWFDEMAAWAKAHPEKDIGLHLTLTSEWQTYRWGPVAPAEQVPGLIDPDGYLWHSVMEVVVNGSVQEVDKEIRAQIDKAIALGLKPDHMDTHMGTLYGSAGFTQAYLKAAMEYGIPAMVIDMSDPVIADKFRAQGYPISAEMIQLMDSYQMPMLDNFDSVPAGKTYEEKRENLFQLVKSLKPGITEIIFHPSIETETIKQITNSWEQRKWEAQLFNDPEVKQFFKDEGVLFTNWIEMLDRYKKAK